MMKVNQRIIRKVAVGIAFGLTLSLVAPVSIPGEQIRVEAAKKDKKKPKIKLSGDIYGLDTFNDYSVDEDSQVIVAPALSTNEINVNSKKLTLKRVDLGK